MLNKWSMPPANQAPQFREMFEQTPPQTDPLNRDVRGYDWAVDFDALMKLEKMINEKWRLPYVKVGLISPEDHERWTRLQGYFNPDLLEIELHPLMSPEQANETLWHEIQHAYQEMEGRMNQKGYNPYPNAADDPSVYYEHPIEIDANDFARQMAGTSLIKPSMQFNDPKWVPNELHLDRGNWNDRDEVWELSPEQLKQELAAMVNHYRRAYGQWQSYWAEVGDDFDEPYYAKQSDYQGWTNWETWNTKLMMDNEQELYNQSREIVKRHRDDSTNGIRELENWTIQHIIGEHNADAIRDAQEWNDIPHHERLDPHGEELREKSPKAYDFINNINDIFGVDPVKDEEPWLIDPNKVNWHEIYQSILGDIVENERYEQGLPPSWQEQPDPDAPGDLTLPDSWSMVG